MAENTSNNFYFVYYTFNGATCMGKVVGEHIVDGKPVEYLRKFHITEEEFRWHWEVLKRKYPYND